MVITERIRVPARYRLISEVGQGGMAVVFRAEDETLKREVAIKVLHPHLASEPESKARLEREAQAVAKLKHDNILEIFDYSGSTADSAYIVTEFIDGRTLTDFLEGSTIKHPEIAALVTAELGGALAHAHGLGIIHRDVKPENVMIRKDGLLKLMDFGIAQVLDLERMTVTGQLLGSPAYMAPELIEGRPLDVRTDVFAVGILLYQMATGVLPFAGKNPHEVLRRIGEGRFADARAKNRLIGDSLWRIMNRALAHAPDDRYPDMASLVVELEAYLVEAGFGDRRDELRAYFADPPAFEAALPARMTPALAASAERHLAAKNTPRALESWNRVLAYAPTDPGVLTALGRFQGRTRRRRLAVYALSAAGTVGLVAAATAMVADHQRHGGATATGGPPTSTSATQPGEAPNALATAVAGASRPGLGAPSISEATTGARGAATRPGAGEGNAERTRYLPARLVRPRGSTADDDTTATDAQAPTPVPGPPVTRTFSLGPTPQNVDVYLDGERQFSYDTDHRVLGVPWNGNHVVEFRSSSGCCFPERVEIGPDRTMPPDNVIARKLKWKPARLVVTTAPPEPGARVMVRDPSRPDHGVVVEPGEETNIPFAPADEGQKDIEVSVDAAGGLEAERVTVRAGERKSVVVRIGASR